MPESSTIISILTRFDGSLLRVEKAFVIILFSVLATVTFAQVAFRYVLRFPLPWTEELAIGLFIWVAFVGSSIALAANDHFSVEIVKNRLSGVALGMAEIVIWAMLNAFLLVIAFYGVEFVLTPAPTMTTLPVSMQWFYSAVPTGAILMLLHVNIHASMTVLKRFSKASGE